MRRRLLLLLLFVLSFWLLFAYLKSRDLAARADRLLDQNKLQEAVLYYQAAVAAFPLNGGLRDSISAIQLRLASDQEYGLVVDQTYAEVQASPPLMDLPGVRLKPGQFFVPILMYHHIRVNPRPANPVWINLNVTPAQLDQQLNYLASHDYHVITLDDLFAAISTRKPLPTRPVILSFDDGYQNFYTTAYPLLQKYRFPAIEFVITGVEGTNSYLTWAEIGEMDRSGLVTFGAHTQHHPNLPDLTNFLIDREITRSRADLQNHLGRPPKWFAYPYGSYNSYIVSEVQKAGFLGAVSTIYGGIQGPDNLFLLQRIGVSGRFDLDEFARRLQNR